ncbi:MAG: hypothetical protein ABJB40_01250, partial [Acidobacteriota bacterium]
MKKSLLVGMLVSAVSVVSGVAQSNTTQPVTRDRVVVTNSMPATQTIAAPTPAPLPAKTPNVVGQDPPTVNTSAS